MQLRRSFDGIRFLAALWLASVSIPHDAFGQFLSTFTYDTEQITVRLSSSGTTLSIPANYIDNVRNVAANPDQAAVLLFSVLPDFEPRTSSNESLFRTSRDRIVSVLLQVLPPSRNLARTKDAQLWDQRLSLIDLPSQFGLEAQKQVPPNAGTWGWKYVYTYKSNDELSTLIICNGDYTVPAPRCTHWFSYDGTRIQLNYDDQHLPQWKPIQDAFQRKLAEWLE
jgi:hypothetical protein